MPAKIVPNPNLDNVIMLLGESFLKKQTHNDKICENEKYL